MKTINDASITNKKIAREHYEEKEIRLFLSQFAELEGKKLSEENEALHAHSPEMPTAKANRAFNKRLRRHFMIYDLKQTARFMFKGYRKLVISLAIILLLVVTLNAEAVRVKFLDIVLQLEEQSLNIQYKQGSQPEWQIGIGWDNAYIPEDIPADFVRREVAIDTNKKEIKLTSYKSEDSYILFRQYDDHAGLNLETKNADEVRRVQINGENGLAMKKKDVLTVAWQMDEQSFVISAKLTELTLEQLIQMAQSTTLAK